MKICLVVKRIFILNFILFPYMASLHAASTVWIAGLGNDADAGTRGLPVETLANALTKVDPNGNISIIDPSNLQPATINTAVTIAGAPPSQIVTTVAGIGLVVNAGPNDEVILRNLVLNGLGIGTHGIQFISGKLLVLDNCKITGFTGTGLDINSSVEGNVVLKNTTISNVSIGINVDTGGTPIGVSLFDVSILGTSTAALDGHTGNISIDYSTFSQNTGVGVLGEGTSQINIANSIFTSNLTAIQCNAGAVVRISNNDIYDNNTGIDVNVGGTVATANNNHTAGSLVPGSPTASIVFQ